MQSYNRLDLIGPRGRREVRLHYEIPEFDELLALVLKRIKWEGEEPLAESVVRDSGFDAVSTGIGPAAMTAMGGGALATHSRKRSALDLNSISAVRMVLRRSRHGSRLLVRVDHPNGSTDVRPKNADPFLVYRAILARMQSTRRI